MSQIRRAPRSQKRWNLLPSTAMLALWRVRQNWLFLLVAGVGLLVALTLVCLVPLLSEVTATAGVRNTLTPENATLSFTMEAEGLSTRSVDDVQAQYLPLLQHSIQPYLRSSSDLTITKNYSLVQQGHANEDFSILLYGADFPQARSHLKLLQGQYPRSTSADGVLDVLLTSDTAQAMNVHVGSTMTLCLYIGNHDLANLCSKTPTFLDPNLKVNLLQVRVAGLFSTSPDPFWHGADFHPVQQEQFANGATEFRFLFANNDLLHIYDQQAASNGEPAVLVIFQAFTLNWYYYLDPARITIDQLDTMRGQLASLQKNLANTFSDLQAPGVFIFNVLPYPYLVYFFLIGPTITTPQSPGLLDNFSNHVAVTRVPVLILSLQLVALILFFVALMADLLVERQADAIAVMRSRGASGLQVFGALLTQCIGLCLIAMALAPLLALLATYLIVARLPGAVEQKALSDIASNPGQMLSTIRWYLLGTVLVAIATMALGLWRVATMDVLRIRRESARSTHNPLWQRLYLDVIAGIVALVGYVLTIYISNNGAFLDTRASTLINAPLALIAPLFLIVGALLLFLRLFPLLIRSGAWIAMRGRGAPPLLAFAQMARAPGRSVRMTMLLALTLAFSIFTLVFTSTQGQHISDLSNYEAGADFSGTLPVPLQFHPVEQVLASYNALPGVQASSAGFVASGVTEGTTTIPVQIMAVDSSSFGRVGIWPQQASSQSPDSLTAVMKQLTAQRSGVVQKGVVPVIVDAVTAASLGLHTGSTLSVHVGTLVYSILPCVVIGEVEHIPTINNNTQIGSVGGYRAPGGILLDYRSYDAYYQSVSNILIEQAGPLQLNHIWLKTSDDQQALAQVRSALSGSDLALTDVIDRRELEKSLSSDPLYVDLVSILALGTAAALLLALLGDILASWLGVRLRLTNFVVLRALGSTPSQVVTMLTWEQGVVYVTALLLGLTFGALLSASLVPTLLLSSAPLSGVLSTLNGPEYYILQRVLPAKLVIPLSLVVAVALLIGVCIAVLIIMVHTVSRPALGQRLRLNED